MVKVTVVLCTKRKTPHIDWALESLKSQIYKDFEYIIVDSLYESRKDEVEKLIKDMNVLFSVLYIPDKPSRWKGKRPALCNGRNTGLIFAKGDLVVFHDDCCRMPDNWLENHVKWLNEGYIVAGNWLAYQNVDKEGKGIIGAFGWEYRSTVIKEPQVVTGGWLYGANFGFPLQVAIDVNGFDEELDGEMGQDDVSFGLRAERKGYKIMYDPSCYLEYYYTDHGLLMSFHEDPNNDIWKGHPVEFNLEPVRRVLKDGIEHFSNEWLTEKLLDDTERVMPYGNTFSLIELRERIKDVQYIKETYEILKDYINPNKYDWRDDKLVEGKINK